LSLNRNEKAAVVTDVSAQAARSQTLALAEYRGLTVEQLNKLRVDARAKGVYLHVLKNTLARRAVAGTPFEAAQGAMVGPLIYGFSEDAVAAAKVISDFAKDQRQARHQGRRLRGQGTQRRGRQGFGRDPQPRSADRAGRRPAEVAHAAHGRGGGSPGPTAWWRCCRSSRRSTRCSLMT
jgi:large subunit ribosomal protein L10